ncbi:hypothetical protein AGMMS49944_20670 [Spirochaetia bacterium]|nr:hypothetical protein AGMMS49944_20670 [Spirochaetia bacterium]
MQKKYVSAELEFDVEFYDVDPMQIVWHGNYIKYFEKSRCALLDTIGYGYLAMRDSGFAFPVTGISAKYIGSFRLGDRVRARAVLEEYENCIKIKYELFNARTGELCTKGASTQMENGGSIRYTLSGHRFPAALSAEERAYFVQ